SCKDSRVQCWGFKDKGIPFEEMKSLYTYMKSHGKTTVLEIVEYDEAESLVGAKLAVECECDILMGTTYSPLVSDYCKKHNLKYMPFAGDVSERPSLLKGDINEIIQSARRLGDQGIHGFDLLGFRYTGDAVKLISEFVTSIDQPVCVAGSIDSYERLDFIKEVSPWAFTIGSAFFDNKFDGTFKEQVNKVYEYIQ
ncbi:hypothetical protein V062_02741, partial [Staphylococcus aureus R0357]